MTLRTIGLIVTLALGLFTVLLPADAQPPGKVYKIGVLRSTFSQMGERVAGHVKTWLILEHGYVEGKNITFESRYAAGKDERLADLAAELAHLPVDVIVTYGIPATRAAKRTTSTIPIVMLTAGDPVQAGLVASLAHPGGNITGMTALLPELNGKRLELLKEAMPGLTRVAVFWNPDDPEKAMEWQEMRAAARALGATLQSLEVRRHDDFEPAFKAAVREHADALLVLVGRLFLSYAKPITDLAIKHRLPTMYPMRYFVDVRNHSLMSYGPSSIDLGRRAAYFVDKILKGARPGDLPVERPTTFELVINLKTAKQLGLTISPSMLFQADKVIR